MALCVYVFKKLCVEKFLEHLYATEMKRAFNGSIFITV